MIVNIMKTKHTLRLSTIQGIEDTDMYQYQLSGGKKDFVSVGDLHTELDKALLEGIAEMERKKITDVRIAWNKLISTGGTLMEVLA